MSLLRKIAILGYGSQGRAWALNLRDSGCDVIVGVPTGDASRKTARKDRIKKITTVGRAVGASDIIVFAFPDHLHGRVYRKDIKPNLNPESALVFLHGFSIHFKAIIPPKDCDVLLLAPLAPGAAVREKYIKNESIGHFYCIRQNVTGRARSTLNQLIRDLRVDKRALIKTTFKEETVGDLFGEQAVLCGGLSQLIKVGYDTLVQAGLSSEKAYLEVAYQLDLIVDLIKKYGIEGMFKRISVAARYGSYLSGPKVIDGDAKKRMKKILIDIQDGSFAERLNSLTPEKIKQLDARLKKLTTPSFEKSARKFSPLRGKK